MADIDLTRDETITVTDSGGAQVPVTRVTQVGVEYADGQEAAARVTQVGVEYADGQTATARITQFGLEYAGPRIIPTYVTQFGIEYALPYVEAAWEPGDSFGPLIWAELAEPTGGTYVAAPVDLPDPASYYHGYKAPTLLGAGRVRRALSDEAGQYEAQRFTVTLDDRDRRWRTYLGARDLTRLLLNRRVVCRMISDTGRRALLRPRTVAIGLVRSYTLE